MKLINKVILVTGAGSGIGSALVEVLLSRGSRVAAVDVSTANLQSLKERLSTNNTDFDTNKLSIHTVDITNKKAVEGLPKELVNIHGEVDGLINCAGIIQPFVRINDLDYEAIDRVMNVNFYGTVYMTKAFLPHLLERPEAYIANVSSMGGFLPVPGQGVYGASKAAVKLFTEALYAELLTTNVNVSIVFPGATSTNITKNSGVEVPGMSEEDMEKQQAMALSAQAVAELIVRGIEKNKPQIFTGKDSNFMNRLYRIHPVYATRFIAKKMQNLLGS
jgi:short-subunit dehydrogenase